MNPHVADKSAPPGVFCFLFEDQDEPFKNNAPFVTASDIRRIVGINDDTPIVHVQPDGTQRQLDEDERVKLANCHKFKRLPRFIRGFDRVDAELELVRKQYPGAKRTASGILLPDFPLPEVFEQERGDVLIPMTPAYPSAPPANFLVPWGVKLRSGQALQNYSGPVGLEGRQWGQFSHRVENGAWRPSQEAADGDNVLSYVLTVIGRLKQGA